MQLNNQRFTIAAGETKRFEMAGRYFELLESAYAIDVHFSDHNGGRVGGMRDALSGFYVNGSFSTVEIYSATAQTLEILITDGTGGSRRQPGIVRVVDGEREKVIAGVCYRGIVNLAGGGAAGPRGQVYNPVGSGKNLYVQAVRLGSSAADSWGLGSTSTQLGTANATAPVNLDRSGPAAVATMWTDITGAALVASQVHSIGFVSASQDIVVVLPRPMLIRPGFGAYVYVNTAASGLRAVIEWEEWPA